jgi:hypothetical protein
MSSLTVHPNSGVSYLRLLFVFSDGIGSAVQIRFIHGSSVPSVTVEEAFTATLDSPVFTIAARTYHTNSLLCPAFAPGSSMTQFSSQSFVQALRK